MTSARFLQFNTYFLRLRRSVATPLSPGMGLLASIAVALLVIPSTGYHFFNGIPLSSSVEFGLLFVLGPFLVSRGARRLWGRVLRQVTPVAPLVLMGLGLIAVVLKVLLFSFGSYAGFAACYHALDKTPVTGSCEKAFANPFYRFTATRVDTNIDFAAWWDPTEPPTAQNWNLSFLNSTRFNYYQQGDVPRLRVPFGATWLGTLDIEEDSLQIRYVGEGELQLEGRSIPLPPQYGVPETVTVPVSSPGSHPIVLSYRFDDGSRIGDGAEHGSYATLRVWSGTPGGSLSSGHLVSAVGPPLVWRILSGVVDLVVIAFAISFVFVYVSLLGRWSFLGLVVCVLAPLTSWLPVPQLFVRGSSVYVLGAAAALVSLVLLSRRHRRRLLLTSYFGVTLLMFSDTWREWPNLATVYLRGGGEDWLMYQSQARSILDTWSLQGGSDVFYFQPMFRYLVFAEHLLLGDGDAGSVILSRTALNFAILWMCWLFTPHGLPRTWRGAVAGGAAVLSILLVNFGSVTSFFQSGASEYPTWVLFPVTLSMLYASPLSRQRVLGCALVGLAFIVRTNQAPALMWMLGCYFLWARTRGWRHLCWGMSAALVVSLLPLAHNLYYGGQPVLTTTSASVPQNLLVSPVTIIESGWDVDTSTRVRRQLDGILQTGDIRSQEMMQGGDLVPITRGLQVLWLLAIVTVFLRDSSQRNIPRLLLLVPLLFLGVHVFYQVWVYYPRHIVIGYLAMGVVTFVSMCDRAIPVSGAVKPTH